MSAKGQGRTSYRRSLPNVQQASDHRLRPLWLDDQNMTRVQLHLCGIHVVTTFSYDLLVTKFLSLVALVVQKEAYKKVCTPYT